MMLEVRVVGVADLVKVRILAVGAVVVRFQRKIGTSVEDMVPAAEEVAAEEVRIPLQERRKGRRWRGDAHAFALAAVVKIALHGELIHIRPRPVRAKAGLAEVPRVE